MNRVSAATLVTAACMLWLGRAAALAVGLPDTGLQTCYNDTAADTVAAGSPTSISRDAGTHPRQDCRYGRDPAAAAFAFAKTGAGAEGFDYTKIANSGNPLPASAALGSAGGDWACTRDNVTGLVWEVKTATSTDLRYFNHIYAWYNTNGATNGGNAGSPDTMANNAICNATLPLCNTQAYVAAVNAAMLCGFTDWRLPETRELLTLFEADGATGGVEPTYFPNAAASNQWTATTFAVDSSEAWVAYNGTAQGGNKANRFYVRLVRGGPF